MSKRQLSAKKRDNSLNPRQLRSTGKLPATVYGKGMESVSIELDTKEFIGNYKKDKNAIFELNIENEKFNTIVKKVQAVAVNDNILNVEFQRIQEGATVKMTIPVQFTGESPAVKAGGNLIIGLTEMEVECLPSNIPSLIEVDLSKLENYEDTVTIANVDYPEGVKPAENPESLVVKVATPKAAGQEESEAAE